MSVSLWNIFISRFFSCSYHENLIWLMTHGSASLLTLVLSRWQTGSGLCWAGSYIEEETQAGGLTLNLSMETQSYWQFVRSLIGPGIYPESGSWAFKGPRDLFPWPQEYFFKHFTLTIILETHLRTYLRESWNPNYTLWTLSQASLIPFWENLETQ